MHKGRLISSAGLLVLAAFALPSPGQGFASVKVKDVLGCWDLELEKGPSDGVVDYAALCFKADGVMLTLVGGGDAQSGVEGFDAAGTYGLTGHVVTFRKDGIISEGWPFGSKTSCDVLVSGNELRLSECSPLNLWMKSRETTWQRVKESDLFVGGGVESP
jgi:hypothetical protein